MKVKDLVTGKTYYCNCNGLLQVTYMGVVTRGRFVGYRFVTSDGVEGVLTDRTVDHYIKEI